MFASLSALRHPVRPGMSAFGSDGATVGVIERVLHPGGTIIMQGPECRFMFPASLVGLVGQDFVVFRGTARELLAFGTMDTAFSALEGPIPRDPSRRDSAGSSLLPGEGPGRPGLRTAVRHP